MTRVRHTRGVVCLKSTGQTRITEISCLLEPGMQLERQLCPADVMGTAFDTLTFETRARDQRLERPNWLFHLSNAGTLRNTLLDIISSLFLVIFRQKLYESLIQNMTTWYVFLTSHAQQISSAKYNVYFVWYFAVEGCRLCYRVP